MKYTRNKRNGMTRSMLTLPVLMVAVVALVMGLAATKLCAHGHKEKIELDEAEIFFEENATDFDLGLQFLLDGQAWERIKIFSPHWSKLVDVKVRGNAKVNGLTELFSEGAEPRYVVEDGESPEMTRPELLALFPPGIYKFYGRTVDGDWLSGTAKLTHNIPCAPDIDVVAEAGTLSVEWEPVTTVVDPNWQPEDEDDDQECLIRLPRGFKITGYEGVFEMVVVDEWGEERVYVNTATLPASATVFTASPEFVVAAAAFRASGRLVELKVEVIAIEASGNKAITEETLWPVDD